MLQSAGRVRGCPAAAAIPSPSSVSHASEWSAAESRRRSFTKRGTRRRPCIELVPSMRQMLKPLKEEASPDKDLWAIWDRWISEIVADFFSVARVGITSTIGLIGVVSLPRAFVFRVDLNDPHPTPWLRVKISAAIGQALYPHPQWARIAALWEELYPREGLDLERRTLFERLESAYARIRGAARRAPSGKASRAVAARGAGDSQSCAGTARADVPGLVPGAGRDVPRSADASLRGAWDRPAPTASSLPRTRAC